MRNTAIVLLVIAALEGAAAAQAPRSQWYLGTGGAGFNVPVAVGRYMLVAPEVSYTHGDVGDHHYHLVSARVKLLWTGEKRAAAGVPYKRNARRKQLAACWPKTFSRLQLR